MMRNPIILILIPLLFSTACSYMPDIGEVIPDRRNEYKKSEALPDLEVPPDLTTDTLNDPMAIPNEEATTLSEFERRKSRQTGGGETVGAAGVEVMADEQWLSLQGSVADIWPKLQEFWQKKGYTLELNDADLGVLETGWLETGSEGSTVFRDKFNLLTESGTGGVTVIFVNGERQERIASDENAEWVSAGDSTELAKVVVLEMNLFFYGNDAPAGVSSLSASDRSEPAPAAASEPAQPASAPRAEILNLADDKVYLALPDEFTRAWVLAEDAILKTGMFIENNDREKGIYYVLYYDQAREEEGVLSKLKFWKEDDGKLYQISLTGVGDKTELVVLNNEGEWAVREEASKILTYIQVQYNNAKSR